VFVQLERDVIAEFEAEDMRIAREPQRARFKINDQLTLRIVLVTAIHAPELRVSWRVRVRCRLHYDVVLAARMDHSNSKVLDYFLLPNLGFAMVKVSLGDDGASRFNTLRVTSLNPLAALCSAKRTSRAYPQTVEEFAAFLAAVN
jgi:hypothetical protein